MKAVASVVLAVLLSSGGSNQTVTLRGKPLLPGSDIKRISAPSSIIIKDGQGNVGSTITNFRAHVVRETNNRARSWLIVDHHTVNRSWNHRGDRTLSGQLYGAGVRLPGETHYIPIGRSGCHYGGGIDKHYEKSISPQLFDITDELRITTYTISGTIGPC